MYWGVELISHFLLAFAPCTDVPDLDDPIVVQLEIGAYLNAKRKNQCTGRPLLNIRMTANWDRAH